MDVSLFFKGFIVGMIISAPIGPVGVLCIQRTVHNGRLSGIISGIAAAIGDSIFAIIAAFGLTFISSMLLENETWIRIFGGFILLYFGIRIFRTKSKECSEENVKVNHFGTFGSAFLLTMSNPLVILSILAVFAILGIVNPTSSYSSISLLILGVFSGAMFLYTVVCQLFFRHRDKMSQRGGTLFNKITGVLILACSGYAFLSLLI